jgi:foldase protein PrsA
LFNADEGTKITGEEKIATGERTGKTGKETIPGSKEIREGDAKKKERRKRLKIAYDIMIIVALAVLMTIVSLRYVRPDSEAVATVNGETITKDELYQAMLTEGGRQVLDRLITNLLILQEGKRLGITVTDEEIDARIQNLINANFYGMADSFYQALEQYGLTEESLKKDIKTELILRKIAGEQISISDEEAREYFKANQQNYNIPEQVEARHILVDTREEAEEILELLKSGRDFAELAGEYSKDTLSAEQGGNLGFFQRGEMVPEFEEAAFSLPVNQVSDPIETTYGFHIIEVLGRKAPKEVAFEEVEEKVREVLLEEQTMEQMNKQVNLLREQASIEYKLD